MVHRLPLLLALLLLPAQARAGDDVAAFYHGRQLRLVVGTAPGGGYDLFARIVARHMAAMFPDSRPSWCRICRPPAGW
jgi:tripartite-type tricarboxylate transporter receptor subunit TctC